MTADEPEIKEDKTTEPNNYANIRSLNVLSSRDLVNWTDNGCVHVAGIRGVSSWSNNSWAPAAAVKEIEGKKQYFLYYADGAAGIGVLVGDSPLGPFRDPVGRPLISRETPGCQDVVWLFDPAVLVDDDGSGYLYFGGGIPEGKQENPGTGRVVKLGADMVSLEGAAVPLDVPYLFEDSGINKIGDTYYYSYCSNWDVTEEASEKYGFRSAEIVYMTSKNPMGPFTLQTAVLKNPGMYFGCYGNNHHCIFPFGGRWYIAYHTETLGNDMKIANGYRCTFIDEIKIREDGVMEMVEATRRGVEQLTCLNPRDTVQAETIAVMAGIQTKETGEDFRMQGTGNRVVCDMQDGAWLAVKGVDFGELGSDTFLAGVIPGKEKGEIEIRLDTLDGRCVGRLPIEPGDGKKQSLQTKLEERVTGIHNLVFVFYGSGYEWDDWKFE